MTLELANQVLSAHPLKRVRNAVSVTSDPGDDDVDVLGISVGMANHEIRAVAIAKSAQIIGRDGLELLVG